MQTGNTACAAADGTAITNSAQNGCVANTTGSPISAAATVGSLINGKSYEAKVLAVNAIGASTYSAAKAVIPSRVPNAPQNLRLVLAPRQFTATWDAVSNNPAHDPSDGGDRVQTYILLYRNVTAGEPYPSLRSGNTACVNTLGAVISNNAARGCAALARLGANPAPTSVTIASLAYGARYEAQVLAVNGQGAGSYSAASTLTPAPAWEPRNFRLSSGDNSFDAVWDAPAFNGGTAITYYFLLYRSGSEAFPTIDAGSAACVGISDGAKGCLRLLSGTLTSSISSLQNGRSYDVRLQALNSVGLGAASAASVRPGGPPEIVSAGSFVLTPRASGFFAVWDEPNSYGLALQHYIVRYRNATDNRNFPAMSNSGAQTACPNTLNTVDAGCIMISGAGVLLHQAAVTDLTNGKSYETQVLGINSLGAGLWSAAKTVVPGRPPNAPQNFRLYRANSAFAAQWDAVPALPATDPANGGYVIQRYLLLYRNVSD